MGKGIHIVCTACNSINLLPEDRLSEEPKCGKCKAALFNAHPVELTDTTFYKHVSNSSIPVVVDFWASWCGPCKIMAPVFVQASAQMEPRVRFAKVNTESEQRLALKFNIRSIPTIVIFSQGQEVARQSGAVDLSGLMRWITNYI